MALFARPRRWSRPARRPTALLAWEVGAGFTHTQNIWGVARHLAAMGVHAVVATADPRAEAWFRPLGADVLQTYLWPVMRTGTVLPEQRPARVLSDILANYAVSRPVEMAAAIAHYDTICRLVAPDIVLCENAFGAQLAARGRYPLIVFGSTLLFLPPRSGDAFAPIDAGAPTPSWPAELVLDDLNMALAASARPPLARLADIFDCDAVLPFGPAAFDPYLPFRTSTVLAPHCPDLPPAMATPTGGDLVVYLHDVTQGMAEVMAAIEALPARTRIYIPSLSAELGHRFSARGHRIEPRMLALGDLATSARLLIHQGGVTLTAAALALGIPQIVLARFHENGIAGAYIAERQLGDVRRLDKVDAEWLVATVGRLASDANMLARCRVGAAGHRAWFAEDPTRVVARHVATILGRPVAYAPATAGAAELSAL